MLLAIGLVTGIVAARALGPNGRGHFAEILFWGNFVAQIGAFGLSDAVTVEAAREGNRSRSRLTVTTVLLALVYTVVTVGIYTLVVEFGGLAVSDVVFAFVLAFVPAYNLGLSLLAIDGGLQRFGLLNAMRVIPQVVYAVAMLLLTAAGLAGAVTFAWTMLAGSALVPAIRAAAAGRALFRRPDPVISRRLIVSGLQFYATSVIGIVRETSDRLVILAVLDQTALGLYAVGLTVAGSAIQNVAGATTTILLPKIVATADEAARARQLATATSASLFVAALMNGVIALASPLLIPILFGGDFAGAVPIAAALCLAQTVRSGANILSYGLRGLDDWKAMPLTAGVALVAFLPLGYVAAGKYGPAGVAAALAASNVAALAFVLHRGVRQTGLPLAAFLVPPGWIFSPSMVRARLMHRA
jgi:O-antigen/teichoic acid export membrane protein